MRATMNPARRTFLKAGAAAGGGLAIGFYLPAAAAAAGPVKLNAYVKIGTDGKITVVCGQSEMGQGCHNALGMLVAEELEVDLNNVHVVQGGIDPAFSNPRYIGFKAVGGFQATGGSSSVRNVGVFARRAGAAARFMLVSAAAERFRVPVSECVAENGYVLHKASGRKLSYGSLASDAAKMVAPDDPVLKEPGQFKIIGKSTPRHDVALKVTGKPIFGIDVKRRGMLTATVAKCPVFGGSVRSFDAAQALKVKGVKKVVQIGSGVAVIADSFWAAKQGRDALQVTWDEGPMAKESTARMFGKWAELGKGDVAAERLKIGNAAAALASGAKRVDAVYEVPFLAHATMEPQNCTAHVRPDGCDVWAPTQNQTGAQQTAMRVTGLPREKVRIHTTFVGGGFGRRGEVDYVTEAVEVSKAVGAPVKVIWTREDDIRHDFYRPATYNLFRAALGPDAMPVAWLHRIVGRGIMVQRGWVPPGQVDRTMVEGAANMPYDIPNLQVEYTHHDTGVPVGFWRSVGASQNAFIVESFVDELAHAARKDPFEYRRALLGKSLRHKGVLELAAQQAGWGTPLPPGRHRGIAVAFSYGSWAAQVAEVSVASDGTVHAHRVVCAIDCGLAVNPDQIQAQMMGGIVWGLTAALRGEITIQNGRVQQSNFHDYPMLRIHEVPTVEVHILPSTQPPGGVGEPGVPPIAPAVANAVFAATGKRIRRLPIRAEDLARA